MPKIVIDKGGARGDTFRITDGGRLHVGRDPSADIVLTDTLVSRKHLSLEHRSAGVFAVDADSLNGMYVNGERVTEARLRPGDKIQAGECLLSFLEDDERRTSGGLVGRTIAGYRIVERLGRGGMGTVYKATQLSMDRSVAVKFLASELTLDPEFVDRFVREARAAGRLSHRNIVGVFDTGRCHGLCYYTMEFVPFGSIRDQIAGGQKLPVANVLPMMVDVAHGLIYAEKKRVVHRDIKPDNLMIGYEGIVKIGDLGIAKTLLDAPAVAQADGVFGSAHFIAPEQALGRDIDCRADIYAMGATFYRVLTGRTLFGGESQKRILLKQIHEKPVRIRDVEPGVPKELARIIKRMIRKNPDKRYRSATEFCGDLERLAEAAKVETS
jgi:serine/threonine protein kinase